METLYPETVVFGYNEFTWELVPGVIDDDAIEAFTDGHCPAFAMAASILTGWDIAVLESPETGGEQFHVICVTDDGMAFDIEGLSPMNEMLKRWNERESISDFRSVICTPPHHKEARVRFDEWLDELHTTTSMTWVMTLLEQYGLTDLILSQNQQSKQLKLLKPLIGKALVI